MFSIYTSLYNLDNGFIDWKSAISNHSCFADELVIATLPKDFPILHEHIQNFLIERHKVKLINCEEISLDDPFFDGKIKNEALKYCTQPYCILLDGDERIDIKDKDRWIAAANFLSRSHYDAFLLPVIDVFNTDKEYKSIGLKWYLSKNLPNLNRGIVNFAKKEDGSIDIDKSDSTELIYSDGSLVKSVPIHSGSLNINSVRELGIKIWHLGWLDNKKRLSSNAFWQDIWDARAKRKITNIIHSEEELNKIESFPHGLKLWYE
jgi:hypothetical protein